MKKSRKRSSWKRKWQQRWRQRRRWVYLQTMNNHYYHHQPADRWIRFNTPTNVVHFRKTLNMYFIDWKQTVDFRDSRDSCWDSTVLTQYKNHRYLCTKLKNKTGRWPFASFVCLLFFVHLWGGFNFKKVDLTAAAYFTQWLKKI